MSDMGKEEKAAMVDFVAEVLVCDRHELKWGQW